MAPGITSPVPGNVSSPFYTTLPGNSRQVSAMSGMFDSDSISNTGLSRGASRRESMMPRTFYTAGSSKLSSVIQGLQHQSGRDLDPRVSSLLFNTDYLSIRDWIAAERMSHLPAEGSSYDKVLAWAQLFAERLNSFDAAIRQFEGGSLLAARLAFGYCAMLLQLGKENAPALMASFGFFYSTSSTLVNLLERTELFTVSGEIKEQLVDALADLVTLVASVSTTFHKSIDEIAEQSISINIYEKFSTELETFRDRCASISDAMWRHQLVQEHRDPEDVKVVKAIRTWLSPEDRVLSHLAENTSHLAHEREEMTCLWMNPYLTHFLKGDKRTLAFTGAPGSGKTVLASVIVDRLQDQIAGVSYKSLFIPINARIPAETTPISIAKTILFQLFEKRIGNVQLLSILRDAYDTSRRTINETDYENILWNALEQALAAALHRAKELVIVVDGVDEASCGEAALLQKLTAATANGTNVKLVTLGAEKPQTASNLMHVPIGGDRVADDIATVVRSHFTNSNRKADTKVFKAMDELEQETLVDQISEAARGSFLWAKLCTKRARQEHSPENLRKLVDTLVKGKPTIADFVLHAIQSPDVSEDAKLMLVFLATADRPLLTRELITLASINPEKQVVTDYKVDLRKILKPLNSLVFLQDGQVYLRHGLIRSAVLDVFTKGKLTTSIKDRHTDLVTRLLVYIKHTVPEQHEPSLSPMDGRDVAPRVRTNPLLDFAVRYWPRHLKESPVFTSGDVPKEFGKIFPATVTLLLLQTTIWNNFATPTLVSYQSIVTKLCRQILTPNHVVTLQSMISLAFLYRELNQLPEAIPLFYEITTISRTLLDINHVVTRDMALVFLTLTEDLVTSTKSEIMTQREELFVLIIECFSIYYGEKSEKTIGMIKALIRHYSVTKETEKEQRWNLKIHTRTTTEYDADDSRDLSIRLNGHKQQNGFSGIIFDLGAESDEVLDKSQWSFESQIKQAEKYIAEGHLDWAERLYIEIWQRVSSGHSEDEKLKAVLDYSRFLQSQKRTSEASSILSSVWEEHKHSSASLSETSTSHFEQIAKVMSTVGLSVAALSIFKRCSEYYQRTNKTQSSSYQEIQKSIQTSEQHVLKQASSSSSHISEEILEQIITEASSSSKIDETSISALRTLLTVYTSEHRWKDASQALKKILRGLWPSLFSASIQDVTLPKQHVDQAVDYANQLSRCYHFRRRVPREEGIRIRVYRAVRVARPVEDKLRTDVTTQLLNFFKTSSQPDKDFTTRQEILDDYTKHYGPEHPIVLKTLFNLAEIARPRPVFIEYYQRIISILNKDSQICKPEALEPVIIVATELWTQSRYSEAVPYFKVLFTTFLNQPKQSPKFQDVPFVQTVFTRYTHCLRTVRTEYTDIHKVTVEYQTKCKTVFGATASITIQATLTLAQVCSESKTFENDAITLYQQLIDSKSQEIDIDEITAILDGIFEEQTAALSKSDSISAAHREGATRVLTKRIRKVRETYGWAHEESLSQLKEVVAFHSKHSDIQTVNTELHESTKQILQTETSSQQLVSAATTIASSYIATKQAHKVVELSQELYRQIIMKDTSKSKETQFDVSSKGRHSLVFLAQLEHSVRQGSSSVTEILATLTTQYAYFEEFRSLTKSKTGSFHQVSLSATRLYQFLLSHRREAAANRVFDDFVAYFIATEGKKTKVTDTAQVKVFLQTMISYLTTHETHNFVRSVGIASNTQVLELLQAKNYDGAANLALAAFQYISAHDVFRTPEIVKFVFTLGVFISGHAIIPQPSQAILKKLRGVSVVIIQEVLRVLAELKINLAQINLDYLNVLIGLLGEQQDYKNLVWILGDLWNNRNKQAHWNPVLTLDLARRYILARYLIGDSVKAARLAEDIVYNCRRVNGARHSSTLEMSTLLSQLYTAIAQRYQGDKSGQHMANKYYKKSAVVHESLLRIFVDPSLAEFEGSMDASFSMDGSAYDLNINDSTSSLTDGEQVRQHLQLLKLSLQRLGDWPKDYSEYENLNASLYELFGPELKGFEGVEKWNLKNFGSGKAASNEDTLDLKAVSWELNLGQSQEIEEEL
ncbi:hypothetical protein N7467_001984 [Penicillium canescens]|nr:hypothetical protein N7467_001984 [Penicillium canescens]